MNGHDAEEPARTLREVAAQTILDPLQPGDRRYADLSVGRHSHDLAKLKDYIETCRDQSRHASATLTGHRGCGKSSELLRLREQLEEQFQIFYVVVDPTLERSCHYTDLLLWLTDALVQQLDQLKFAPNPDAVNGVVEWFADRYLERTQIKRSEIEAQAKAEVKSGFSIFTVGLKLLASVKSCIRGSVESRDQVRNHVAQYADKLIDNFNILVNEVSGAFKKKNLPSDLLIIVDNLDRLDADAGRRLFIGNGELLQRVQAHIIFTVPIAAAIAPDRISSIFRLFTLPTIDPAQPDACQSLVDLVGLRIDINKLFQPPSLVEDLAKASGGSLRDLIRLLDYAQQEAKVTNGLQFDADNVVVAIGQLREDYKKSLVPAGTYYPVLARIHTQGDDGLAELAGEDETKIQAARRFFREMLNNGTVLEYNGGNSHFAVHPVVQQIEAFKNAVAECQKAKVSRVTAKKAGRTAKKAAGKVKKVRSKAKTGRASGQ